MGTRGKLVHNQSKYVTPGCSPTLTGAAAVSTYTVGALTHHPTALQYRYITYRLRHRVKVPPRDNLRYTISQRGCFLNRVVLASSSTCFL